MAENEWQRRIARAQELGAQYSFAAEILGFYEVIAHFQKNLYWELERSSASEGGVESEPFARRLQPDLTHRFGSFLSVVERNGPDALREAARELRDGGEDSHFQLLTVFWNESETAPLPPGPRDFFARAFLQPCAACLRSRSDLRRSGTTPYRCPF